MSIEDIKDLTYQKPGIRQSANETQVGGVHYGGGNFQHWDYVAVNGINYFLGVATKYVCRHRAKGGKEDLKKAAHYVGKLLELHDAGRPYPYRRDDVIRDLRELGEVYHLTTEEIRFCALAVVYRSRVDLEVMLKWATDAAM